MFWVGMQRRLFSFCAQWSSTPSVWLLLFSNSVLFFGYDHRFVLELNEEMLAKCERVFSNWSRTTHWGAANSLQQINMLKYMQSFSHLRVDWWICTSEMQRIDFLSLCREQCMHKRSPEIYLSLYCVILQKQSYFYLSFWVIWSNFHQPQVKN